jgi:hypothetical protein
MLETTPRLPQSRTRPGQPRKGPEWLDALTFYKRSFDASSADTLADGAEAFAEMSPDGQAFHAAHPQYRQVQALGDVFAILRRVEARLARLDESAGGAAKHIPIIRKALACIARAQQSLLGGLEAAVNGDCDDDDGGDEPDDEEDDLDAQGEEEEEEDAEEIEDEDHGHGDEAEVVVPDVVLPARREPPEAA